MNADNLPKLKPTSSAGDWGMFRRDKEHTGYSPEQLKLPLGITWKFITNPNPGIPSSPAIAGGVAYFCSDSRLYAVNAETGAFVWVYPTDRKLAGQIRTSPLVGDDLVYFGAGDGKLYAIRKEDGQQAWNFVTGAAVNSSPILSDGILYFGSASAKLYALDAHTGQPKWPGGFRTHDEIETAPAIANGMIYFVSRDMVLFAASATTGQIKWSARVPPPSPSSTPIVVDSTVYLATGSILQAFQAQSGHLKWERNLPDEITAAPAVTSDALYFPCKDGKLYALTINNRYKWKSPVNIAVSDPKDTGPANVAVYSYACPVVAGNMVFLGANKGSLLAVDADTGEVKWRYNVSPSQLSNGKLSSVNVTASPVVSNGSLYVLADDGTLISFTANLSDYTAPEITGLYPARDSLMPGNPPFLIQATVKDAGSGINPSSITMQLDEKPVKCKVVPGQGTVQYSTPVTEPVQPLSDGRHTATVSVADWLGNKTVTQWSFNIDNRITAAPPSEQPANGQQRPGMPGVRPGMGGGGMGRGAMGGGGRGNR